MCTTCTKCIGGELEWEPQGHWPVHQDDHAGDIGRQPEWQPLRQHDNRAGGFGTVRCIILLA